MGDTQKTIFNFRNTDRWRCITESMKKKDNNNNKKTHTKGNFFFIISITLMEKNK